MRLIKMMLIILMFGLTACASCQLKPDVADAPASLDQARIPISINGLTEVGIHGMIAVDAPIQVRSFGASTVTVRGLEDCGFVTSGATKEAGWVAINPKGLPQKEFCLFNLQVRTNQFDAPALGHVLVRRFLDPNVRPMTVVMNGVSRHGVNWVQLQKSSSPASGNPGILSTGINEDKNIILVFDGAHSGHLNISGCGFSPDSTDYTNQDHITKTVDYLYRSAKGITESCVFTITANHDDALKESATIFVKAYNGIGSFLDAPLVHANGSSMCVGFVDPYVVGIGVNGNWARGQSMCVDKAGQYVIEGVTTRQRIFYGEHDGSDWTVMK